MNLIPLIETSRGDTPECWHFGAIAVTDLHGKLIAHAGNPEHLTFTRSTLKAMQALPFIQKKGHEFFNYQAPQLAMLCASHNGEENHVEQASTMLEKAGLNYKALKCGCHIPSLFEAINQSPPNNLTYDERHHNCSGKHSGFVSYCVQHGHTLDDYIDPYHPLQIAVRQAVADVAGLSENELAMGIDGCSAPNYAMPLQNLARCYARLASASSNDPWGEQLAPLRDAMLSHPELVSGTGRNDLLLTQVGRGDWVCKIGADGVQTIGSKSRGQALAIKIADGSKPALYTATVACLNQLGWLDTEQKQQLEKLKAPHIINIAGKLVGKRYACFQLNFKAN